MTADPVTLVTGASRGIGAAVARRLAETAGTVVLAARSESTLQEVASDVEGRGAIAIVRPVDVTDHDAVRELVQSIDRTIGPIDALVNNVGGNPYFKHSLDWSMQDWDHVHNLNLRSAFSTATEVARTMVDRGRPGSIVFVSSVGGDIAGPNTVPYAVAKAGLTHLARGLAVELAPFQIRVNAVAPGFVATDLTQGLRERSDMLAELAAAIPLGRLGLDDEIAAAVSYLVKAEYHTGSVLTIDGGYSLPPGWPVVRSPSGPAGH